MISKLEALGFTAEDCQSALEATQGRLDEAATWLTQYAEPTSTKQKVAETEKENEGGFKISGFEVLRIIIKALLSSNIALGK